MSLGFAAEDRAIGHARVGDIGIGEDAKPFAVALGHDQLAAGEEVGDGAVAGVVGIGVEVGLADQRGEGAVARHFDGRQRLLRECRCGEGQQQE